MAAVDQYRKSFWQAYRKLHGGKVRERGGAQQAVRQSRIGGSRRGVSVGYINELRSLIGSNHHDRRWGGHPR